MRVASGLETPLDSVDRLIKERNWAHERDNDEIKLCVQGQWAPYVVTFLWMPTKHILHLACGFEFKAPADRVSVVHELLLLVNANLWLGHFDYWPEDDVVLFRHGMYTGGIQSSEAHCSGALNDGLEVCDQFFPAFNGVAQSGLSAKEALEAAVCDCEIEGTLQ